MRIGLRMKQAKSNSNGRNLEYRGISNRPGIGIMEVGYFQYMELEIRGIPHRRESNYGSQMDVRSDQRLSRQ